MILGRCPSIRAQPLHKFNTWPRASRKVGLFSSPPQADRQFCTHFAVRCLRQRGNPPGATRLPLAMPAFALSLTQTPEATRLPVILLTRKLQQPSLPLAKLSRGQPSLLRLYRIVHRASPSTAALDTTTLKKDMSSKLPSNALQPLPQLLGILASWARSYPHDQNLGTGHLPCAQKAAPMHLTGGHLVLTVCKI